MSIVIEGKFNKATVHSSVPQETALNQIRELVDQPFMKDTEVHIMPDYHAGVGCVIGTTIKLTDKVVPNLVGVDVGCGVMAWKIGNVNIDFQKLDEAIRRVVPNGKDIFDTPDYTNNFFINAKFKSDKFFAQGIEDDKTTRSLGTLGGGNHFIEIAVDSKGNKYLLVHTGSRYVGAKVAKHHQTIAKSKANKVDVQSLIQQLKTENRHNEIEAEVKKLKANAPKIPRELTYVEGEDFERYISDMKLAQEYACANRREICINIFVEMGWSPIKWFDTVHNYIDTESMILRKGAVRAMNGENLVIPLNMADGTLLCRGKGNPDWNYSAPHGAGRIMSRTQAKANLNMNDFKNRMNNVWSSTVVSETLDEAPQAYKPMQEIIDAIGETADVIDVLKPLYNFKGIE